MSRRRAVVFVWAVGALLGCDIPPSSQPTVAISDSAGVTIYEVSDLPTLSDTTWAWSLELERAISTAEQRPGEPPLLYNPQGVLRLSDGTFVVLDAGGLRLAVLPALQDTVVARFGRSGEGPGEVLSTNGLLAPGADMSFWLVDPGNQRRSRFGLDGELLEEARLEVPGLGGLAKRRPGSHEAFMSRVFMSAESGPAMLEDRVLRLDLAVGRFEAVAPMPPRHESRSMNTSDFPFFAPQGGYAPVESGGTIVGRTDGATFEHYNDDGVLIGLIRLPLRARAVDMEDIPALAAEIGRDYAPAARATKSDFYESFPIWSQLWPVRDSLFALEHTRFASPEAESELESSVRVWRIFSVTGQYAGALRLPPGFGYPYQFDGDRLVGIKRDDFGVATIESYRLVPPSRQ